MRPEHRYEVALYWSDVEQAFIAEVPELPGCAADGATYAASLAAVEVVITERVATARTRSSRLGAEGTAPLRLKAGDWYRQPFAVIGRTIRTWPAADS